MLRERALTAVLAAASCGAGLLLPAGSAATQVPAAQSPAQPSPAAAEPAPRATAAPAAFDFAARRQHWAWQPLADPPVPVVADAQWPRDPLDAFVLARLEAAGLAPAAAAAPHAWLRRVWFDLVGLPPPPDRVVAFVRDDGPAARAAVVDELLASPHFGERWARHWLDLVRYAESLGHEYDFRIPNAWRYRDYVVRALNADVPYDRLVTEHVAGDLLATPRIDPVSGQNESVQGTAFWWFAEQTHSPVDSGKAQADRIDNQVDVLGKAFLGVTVACARCHDHKFDAIRAADYYALYGFLKSSRYVQQPLYATPDADLCRADRAHRRLAALAAAARPAAAANTPSPAVGAADSAPLRPGEHLFADLSQPLAPGWQLVGDAFGSEAWSGPFVTGGGTDAATTLQLRELPGGAWRNSAALDRLRNGVLLSPTFVIAQPFVHVEVAGESARVQLVVDGFHLPRDPIYGNLHQAVRNPEPHWLTFRVERWLGRSAHLQWIDQVAGDLADPDQELDDYPPDGWLAARRVLFSSTAEAPGPTGGGSTFEIGPGDAALAQACADRRAALAALPPVATLPGMADGTGEDEHVFVRGNHKDPGAPSPRRFLEAIDGDRVMALPAGSGRLELAQAMFAEHDPLPARVLVNRIWHHLFGRGLVRSVDNLGALGDRPSHPELLDRLARDTIRSGWSQKALIRRIVLSASYAMDSTEQPEAAPVDPDNRLLHRQNLRRLQGEAVRDALLCLGDRLDPELYGPPVPLHLTEAHKARGKPRRNGPIDGRGRRSLYLAVQRNFLPELLCAFDLPTPFATVGARNVSNVPAQALAMGNDAFVHGMCQLAADHLLADEVASAEARLQRLFLSAFARPADASEAAACLQFVSAQLLDGDEPHAWTELVHVLVNKKEFLFLP